MIGDIVAKNIVALRKQKNLTQGELSRHINYSDKVISKWERGESLPDIEALTILADFFLVSLDSLTKPAETALTSTDGGRTDGGKADSGRTDSGRADSGKTDSGNTLGQTADSETQNQSDFATGAFVDLSDKIEGETQNLSSKAEWDAEQKSRQKKLISRGARIASLIILPLFMNVIYILQTSLFSLKFLSPEFYFLSVIPMVLLANLAISFFAKRTFNSTEVLFLLFAFLWTSGIVIIYTLWHIGVVASGSQRMRIWYILLSYNIIIATAIVLVCMGIKKIIKKKSKGQTQSKKR